MNLERAVIKADEEGAPSYIPRTIHPILLPEYAGLTARQVIFCNEYLKDFSVGAASIRAGYATGSYGHMLMQRLPVQAYLRDLLKNSLFSMGVTQERVLVELARIAFANITDAVVFDGEGVDIQHSSTLLPETRAAIRRVKETKEGVEIEMYNKMDALKVLADHLGMKAPAKKEVETTHKGTITFSPDMGLQGGNNRQIAAKQQALTLSSEEVSIDGGE